MLLDALTRHRPDVAVIDVRQAAPHLPRKLHVRPG